MKYLNKDVCSVFVFVCLMCSSLVSAEEQRDYYAEPGLNPFQDSINQHQSESIDPFGGTLQLKYTDMMIPGNGGMDIRINRSYISLQEKLGLRKTSGVGWTMHFGRVMVDSATLTDAISNMCQDSVSDAQTSKDNPSIEFIDGGRELLLREPSGLNAYLISQSNWKMECKTGIEGVIVTSPDGTQYTMSKLMYESASGGFSTTYSYLTTEIKDLQGNWIKINYADTSGFTYITQITTSDNRIVDYTYYPTTTDNHILLKSITSNNQTTTYNYEQVVGSAIPYYHLKEVVRADGTKWIYDYYPQITTLGQAGSHSLKTVTYPNGGTISYEYKPINFDPLNSFLTTTAITKKTIGGRNITSATWTYQYDPSTTIGNDLDITTVLAPNGKTVYEYYGYASTVVTGINTRLIGLQKKKEIFDISNKLLHTEQTEYELYLLSNENFWVRDKLAINTYVPRIKQKLITREGTNYITDFSNYDVYGNVGHVVETGNDDIRTTDYTYYIDTTNWIVNQLEDETITGIGTIDRTFNLDGTLKSESKYGVLTEYTYHPTGDLETVTDARGKVLNYKTRFNDYYRGIAREVINPVSNTKNIITRKVVNDTGTVERNINGRGFASIFTYDGLNRLKTITFPKAGSAAVGIVYTATGKTLTRGDLEQNITVDGFGQTINSTNKDTLKNITITSTQNYDALGQMTFQSYPNETIVGTNFQYDGLGRQIRIDHPDTSYRTFEYLTNNQTKITNERSIPTTYSFRSYGSPSEQSLIKIDSPENISTIIDRNQLGQQTRVWQGAKDGAGIEKLYGYDGNYFLTSITQPEDGTTIFSRDLIGNLEHKLKENVFVASFNYDYQNRTITRNNYDTNFLNVTITYDDNSNIKELKRGSGFPALSKTFTYDDNDNLYQEFVRYNNLNTFTVDYDYTNSDHLNTIKYPSGRVVTYSPDALGRPTQASPYLTSVDYYSSGQIKQMTYANGQVTNNTLNNRLWIENISVTGISSATNLTYGYDFLGNIKNITDANESSYNRSFSYDNVDRLTVANGIWGTGAIFYDELGNIKSKTIGSHSLTYSYVGQPNRIASITGSETYDYSYDQYGNITGNGTNVNSYVNKYDNEGNLLQSLVGGAQIDYRYDGNNRRVVKDVDISNRTYYIYTQSDNLLGEYDNKGVWKKEFVYLGSQMVADATRVPDPAPSIPTSISVPTASANGNYTINWQASAQFNGINPQYKLYESTTNTFSTETLVYSGTDLTVSISGKLDGSYYYRLKACNHDGCSAFITGANAVKVVLLPGIPGVITVPDIGRDGNYKVSWSIANGIVDNYQLYEATLSDFSNAVLLSTVIGVEHVVSANQEGQYYYKVRACNVSGCGGYQENTTPVIVKYPKVAPTVIPPSDMTRLSTGTTTTIDIGVAQAFDDIGPILAVANNTGPFVLGDTVVTWTAINSFTQTQATQNITILDSSLPNSPGTINREQEFQELGDISQPAVANDGSYYITKDMSTVDYTPSKLIAFDSTGLKKWEIEGDFSAKPGHTIFGPTVNSKGQIILFDRNHNLLKYSSDGTLVWQEYVGDISRSRIALSSNDDIYFVTGNSNNKATLVAYADNGNKKWSYSIGTRTDSYYYLDAPTLDENNNAYFVAGYRYDAKDNQLYSISPNGALRWQRSLPTWVARRATIGIDGSIYIVSSNRTLSALHAFNEDGSQKWDLELPFHFGTLLSTSASIDVNGNVYLAGEITHPGATSSTSTSSGVIYSISPSGKINWNYEVNLAIKSVPVIATDGTIYFATNPVKPYVPDKINSGSIYALNSNGTLRWEYDLNLPGSSNDYRTSQLIKNSKLITNVSWFDASVGSNGLWRNKILALNILSASAQDSVWPSANQSYSLSNAVYPCALTDTDNDGLSDCFEKRNGMNTDDPADALEDFDADGLTNFQEFNLGTHLYNIDSDGDGVSDSAELSISTNPNSSDTDSDGMRDDYEVQYGLNPLVYDAHLDPDNDGNDNYREFSGKSDPFNSLSIPQAGSLWYDFNTNMSVRNSRLNVGSQKVGYSGITYVWGNNQDLYRLGISAFDVNNKKLWEFNIPTIPDIDIDNEPVVALDGSVYFISAELVSGQTKYNLVALDNTGQLKWSKQNTDWTPLRPVVGQDGTVYWPDKDATTLQHLLRAYNPDGSIKFEINTSQCIETASRDYFTDAIRTIVSSLTVTNNEILYTCTTASSPYELFSYDLSGNFMWQINPLDYGYSSSYDHRGLGHPFVAKDGTIYFSVQNESHTATFALNSAGNVLWYKPQAILRSLHNNGPVVLTYNNSLAMLDTTGNIQWEYSLTPEYQYVYSITPVIDSNGNIYFVKLSETSRDIKLVSLDSNGNLLFEKDLEGVNSLSIGPRNTLLVSINSKAFFFNIKPGIFANTQWQSKNHDLQGSNSSQTPIVDKTPAKPVVTVIAPADIIQQATDVLTPIDIGVAYATVRDGNPLTALADNSGPYPLGTTKITWSASDTLGNTGYAEQYITVVDSLSPELIIPADISIVISTYGPEVLSIGTATATDMSGSVTIENDAPASFPLGDTWVTWTATDSSGNTIVKQQKVTVITDLPIVTAPADQIVEAIDVLTPVNLGTATVSDNDGPLTATADISSPFGIGTHVVTWTATDAKNNVGTDTQTITVVDTTAPAVVAPADISAEATGTLTSVNLGSASASDLVDGVLTPVPNKTGPFSLGIHTITWSVTDAAGNVGNAVQTVTVQDTTAPVTTGSFVSSTSKGITYFDITLTVSETSTTYFRLTSGATILSGGTATVDWQTYSGAIKIQLDKRSTSNFEYYSVDSSNNTEVTKTEVLQ